MLRAQSALRTGRFACLLLNRTNKPFGEQRLATTAGLQHSAEAESIALQVFESDDKSVTVSVGISDSTAVSAQEQGPPLGRTASGAHGRSV